MARTSTNCSEKFSFAGPSTDVNGWMLQPALPFGTYKVCVTPVAGSTRVTSPPFAREIHSIKPP